MNTPRFCPSTLSTPPLNSPSRVDAAGVRAEVIDSPSALAVAVGVAAARVLMDGDDKAGDDDEASCCFCWSFW